MSAPPGGRRPRRRRKGLRSAWVAEPPALAAQDRPERGVAQQPVQPIAQAAELFQGFETASRAWNCVPSKSRGGSMLSPSPSAEVGAAGARNSSRPRRSPETGGGAETGGRPGSRGSGRLPAASIAATSSGSATTSRGGDAVASGDLERPAGESPAACSGSLPAGAAVGRRPSPARRRALPTRRPWGRRSPPRQSRPGPPRASRTRPFRRSQQNGVRRQPERGGVFGRGAHRSGGSGRAGPARARFRAGSAVARANFRRPRGRRTRSRTCRRWRTRAGMRVQPSCRAGGGAAMAAHQRRPDRREHQHRVQQPDAGDGHSAGRSGPRASVMRKRSSPGRRSARGMRSSPTRVQSLTGHACCRSIA